MHYNCTSNHIAPCIYIYTFDTISSGQRYFLYLYLICCIHLTHVPSLVRHGFYAQKSNSSYMFMKITCVLFLGNMLTHYPNTRYIHCNNLSLFYELSRRQMAMLQLACVLPIMSSNPFWIFSNVYGIKFLQ